MLMLRGGGFSVNIRVSGTDTSDLEQDKKLLQDYIREVWNG